MIERKSLLNQAKIRVGPFKDSFLVRFVQDETGHGLPEQWKGIDGNLPSKQISGDTRVIQLEANTRGPSERAELKGSDTCMESIETRSMWNETIHSGIGLGDQSCRCTGDTKHATTSNRKLTVEKGKPGENEPITWLNWTKRETTTALAK